jgi:tRNAThr (cytosine32-N3)-methyltransferase
MPPFPEEPPSLSSLSITAPYESIAHAVQPPHLPSHRSHHPTNNLKRTDPFQFGSRYLLQDDNIFEFNAWDHVETDEDYKTYSEAQYSAQRSSPVSEYDKGRFNKDPSKWWDLFYKNNKQNFFKDRKWLRQEFPVLEEVTRKGAGRKCVVEVGAGAGNTAFPLVRCNENEEFVLHAVDFSKKAVEVMRASEFYDEKVMRADVWDLTADELPPGVEEGNVDVVILVFVLSALSPGEWETAVRNVWRCLRRGGVVLFRDYGRGDLAQVRFKKGRWMGENFYVRGDGTRVYFWDVEELRGLWEGFRPGEAGEELGVEEIQKSRAQPGLEEQSQMGESGSAEVEGDLPTENQEAGEEDENVSYPTEARSTGEDPTTFEVLDLGVDRRLLVNRKRELKMYRCWLQGRFRKR